MMAPQQPDMSRADDVEIVDEIIAQGESILRQGEAEPDDRRTIAEVVKDAHKLRSEMTPEPGE
jgi:hypothetical protein